MFEKFLSKKYKNLIKFIKKDFDAECGVCLFVKNTGEYTAVCFNKSNIIEENKEKTIAILGNLVTEKEKEFNDKMIELFSFAFDLKEKSIDKIIAKHNNCFIFTQIEFKAYINEYKKNLENGWHIISLKFIPHLKGFDNYLTCAKVLRYGNYNEYRISDKFVVCETRPLSPTCNKFLAYPRDVDIFNRDTLDNLEIYEKVKDIFARKTVENLYFLKNNYEDIDLEKYSFKWFENEKNKREFFNISANIYIKENGDFVAYSGTNKRQSNLVNYIHGNIYKISNQELTKIVYKLWLDNLNEDKFFEDIQIDRKNNIVASYENADYKKDKCTSCKWFIFNISNNEPNMVHITQMKNISYQEWGGGSRNSISLDINVSYDELMNKVRELFDYKCGILLTHVSFEGRILDVYDLYHIPLKEMLNKRDFEHLDLICSPNNSSALKLFMEKNNLEAGDNACVSYVGFDICRKADEICTYPFITIEGNKLYLNRKHSCLDNKKSLDEFLSIIDFSLNDAIYYDLKRIEPSIGCMEKDKIEVNLYNYENDKKYHIKFYKNGDVYEEKQVARTKILNMLSILQDHFEVSVGEPKIK